ncbi:MAG TPA: hypothetical protein VH436_01200 [Vicinamibacterales bacterium]|jgi:hypothetical protein
MSRLLVQAPAVETAARMKVREIHVRPPAWIRIIFTRLVNLLDRLCAIRVASESRGILPPQRVHILAGLSTGAVSCFYSVNCFLPGNTWANLNANPKVDDGSGARDIPGAMELIEAPWQGDKGHATS